MANQNSNTSILKPADTKLVKPHMTFAEAKTKVNDQYSGLKLLSLVRHISLPPRFLSNTRAGIREQLNAHINVYNESTNGVLVAYSNVKAMQQTGMILYDEPYIHFKVRADAVYFQPQPGELLTGTVNKVGKDHIGCLVHGSFNVSLKKPRKDCQVKVGDEVVFEVLQTTPHVGLLAITGRLQQAESSAAKRRRTDSLNAELDVKSEKRQRQNDTLDLSRTLNQEPVAGSSDFRSKRVDELWKTIKSERLEESVLLDSTVDTSQNETCDGEISSRKKRKKKRKSSQSEQVSLVDGSSRVSLERTDDHSSKKKRRRSSQSVSDSTMDDTLDTSQNGTFDECSSKPKKKKKRKKEKSKVKEEHSGEFERSRVDSPVEERPGSPQSVDSAIGSLTNGMDSVKLKFEPSWDGNYGGSIEGISSANKQKKRKKKSAT